MKNYFDFRLAGSKVFVYYVWAFVAICILAMYNISYYSDLELLQEGLITLQEFGQVNTWLSLGANFLYIVLMMFAGYFIMRESITALNYNGEPLRFEGSVAEYSKITLIGSVLSVITLGIYSAWYTKKIMSFFARNTSYGNIRFQFKGKAYIYLLIVFIPLFMIGFITGFAGAFAEHGLVSEMALGITLLASIIIISGISAYGAKCWHINFTHNNYTIRMSTKGKIKGVLFYMSQIFLSIFTLGLYIPFATIFAYNFVIKRIEAKGENGESVATVGSDVTIKNDILYIYGQTILSCITLGLYFPWMYANVSRRLVNKTYIIE